MKKLLFVGGFTLLLVVTMFSVGTHNQGIPNTVTPTGGDAIVIDFGDPYLSSRALGVAALGLIMLAAVWYARPPKNHPEWAGTSVSSAMFAVVVFCVCTTLLAFLFHSGQAGTFTAILDTMRRSPR